MNTKTKKYLDMFREVKIASAATVDEYGNPRSRIVNVMISSDKGMYIVTSRGKPFYKQLIDTGRIALSAMCPDCQSLQFYGKVKKVDQKLLKDVFDKNPGMNEVYPGDTRYALEVFLIYEGHGEWFDLLNYPIKRESFELNTEETKVGFEIMDNCIECGKCIDNCPQKCIQKGTPYKIKTQNCLYCGLCEETCPADAIKRLHS